MITITPAQFVRTGKPALIVQTPYHPDFPPRARRLGGHWHAIQRHWTFDARDDAAVRELCWAIYGTDGTPIETMDIELTLPETIQTPELWRFGRLILDRQGWQLGEGVRLLCGHFDATARGVLGCTSGIVLLVRDVPVSLVDPGDQSVRPYNASAWRKEPRGTVPEVFRTAFGGEP